ncbi:hypothetical protein KEM48_003810 [Puccinia striiformis f. sp. tritici PST-130]|nr:hypothetical protein KEM48_003810 [Puccinia striiformis f. sp. tritici PST-130]
MGAPFWVPDLQCLMLGPCPAPPKTGPGPSLEVRYSQIKIEANADPLKLLDQISTNHKDIYSRNDLETLNRPNLNGRSQKSTTISVLTRSQAQSQRKKIPPIKNHYQANSSIEFLLS